jgi:phosphatidate phosphatase PAH1
MKKFTLLILLCLNYTAFADVYEVIDKNGRKTYTDKPPLNQPDSKPVRVAPNTGNTWSTDSTTSSNTAYFDELKRKQNEQATLKQTETDKKSAEDTADKTTIESAEKALQNAREVKAGDFYRNREGGIHYTQDYLNRVRAAEEQLQRAKNNTGTP